MHKKVRSAEGETIMSRTVKDKPFRVQLLENYKQGKIDHDHELLGYSRTIQRTAEYEFHKDDAADIVAFRKFLNSEGYEYTTYEKEPYEISAYRVEQETLRPQYEPRRVVFAVKYDYIVVEYSEYCTDFEHYDQENHVDIRDGKKPVCTPSITYSYSTYYDHAGRDEHPNIEINTTLQHMAKAYNSGADLDELEDYEQEPLQRYFKPGSW